MNYECGRSEIHQSSIAFNIPFDSKRVFQPEVSSSSVWIQIKVSSEVFQIQDLFQQFILQSLQLFPCQSTFVGWYNVPIRSGVMNFFSIQLFTKTTTVLCRFCSTIFKTINWKYPKIYNIYHFESPASTSYFDCYFAYFLPTAVVFSLYRRWTSKIN